MKYILRTILSLIWCPFASIILTLVILLKGLWGNGFYVWMRWGMVNFGMSDDSKHDCTKKNRHYLGEIFRWRFVKHWWNWNAWHDSEEKEK